MHYFERVQVAQSGSWLPFPAVLGARGAIPGGFPRETTTWSVAHALAHASGLIFSLPPGGHRNTE